MTSLPVCNEWTFSSTGLLVKDWLLTPTRPLDLSLKWGLHKNGLPNLTLSITHNSTKHNSVDAFFYLFLPTFPLLTFICSLANTVREFVRHVPYKRRYLEQCNSVKYSLQLLVYSLHMCIISLLSWILVLLRYIPVHHRPFGPDQQSSDETATAHPISSKMPSILSSLPHILTANNILQLNTAFLLIYFAIDRLCSLKGENHTRACHSCRPESVKKLKTPFHAMINQQNGKGGMEFSCNKFTSAKPIIPSSPPNHVHNSPNEQFSSTSKAFQTTHSDSTSGVRKYYELDFPPDGSRQMGTITVITTALLICATAFVLPELWNYSIDHADQTANHWIVRHTMGHILYEYVYSIFGCIIPVFLLTICSLLLMVCIYREHNTSRTKNRQTGFDDPFDNSAKKNSIILTVILIHSFPWIACTIMDACQRMACLLHMNTEPSQSKKLWLDPKPWIWIELVQLICELALQAYLLSIRLCLAKKHKSSVYSTNSIPSNERSFSSDESKLHSDDHLRKSMESRRMMMKSREYSKDDRTDQTITPLPLMRSFAETSTESDAQYKLMNCRGQIRSYESTPVPYSSFMKLRSQPYTRNPENMSLHLTPVQAFHIKPKGSTVNLKYSPRSRHPYNGRINHIQCSIPPNTPVITANREMRTCSPPPLPALPQYNLSMIGDASVYSSPPGSPKIGSRSAEEEYGGMKIMNL